MGKSVAWMLRKDGQAFSVPVHPYGDEEDSQYIIANADWLYEHTNISGAKEDIVNLIAAYALENDCKDVGDFVNFVISEHKNYNNEIIKLKFIEKIKDQLEDAIDLISLAGIYDSSEYNQIVIDNLNNEFCRVRAGGLVDSSSNLGDIYFRISSTGFNWFDVIWAFVYENQHRIDTVTIVKDNNNFDNSYDVYRHNGVAIDKMPVDDFINLSGHPVFEKLQKVGKNSDNI